MNVKNMVYRARGILFPEIRIDRENRIVYSRLDGVFGTRIAETICDILTIRGYERRVLYPRHKGA